MASNPTPTPDNSEPLADRANVGSDATAGGPPPSPTTAGAPSEPSPTGSAEPATQAVSGTADPTSAPTPEASGATPAAGRVVPPSPQEYQMPDEYASESPVDKVKDWAQAHPGLALLAAGGIGLVVGRILVGLTPDPEPPSLADRVERRAKDFKNSAKDSYGEAKDTAGEAAAASAAALAAAAVALKEAAEKAGEKATDVAEEGAEKAKDFADVVSDAVKVAVTGIVAKKADDWIKKVRS